MYIYTKFCFAWAFKWLNTLTLERVSHAFPPNHLDLPALMPANSSKLAYREGLYPSGRVMMAQGPLHGDARSSHGISVEGEAVTQKINA